MHLTNQQRDIINGALLGDGCLSTESNGKTWRFRALHKTTHLEYLSWQYTNLKNLCNTGILHSLTTDKRTGQTYSRHYFNTTTSTIFNNIATSFYTAVRQADGSIKFVKDVPNNVSVLLLLKATQPLLTPLAVAVWYQDDGALKSFGKSNAMRICTDSFSEAGVDRLIVAMSNLYSIKLTKHKTRNSYRILVPERESAKFRDLISPYLINCMRYKVSDGNRGHL